MQPPPRRRQLKSLGTPSAPTPGPTPTERAPAANESASADRPEPPSPEERERVPTPPPPAAEMTPLGLPAEAEDEFHIPAPAFASPFEPRRRTKLYWALGLVGVLAVALLFGGRPAYRAIKTWRAHRFVAQAERLVELEKLDEALEKVQVAYQMSPNDGVTLRAAAKLSGRLGHPQAIVFWQNLLASGDATAADHQELATLALQQRRLEVAKEQIDWLLKERAEEPDTLRLAAELSFLSGDTANALAFARRYADRKPGTDDGQILLARILVNSKDAADQLSARRMLKEFSTRPDGLGLESLSFLLALPNQAPDEIERIALLLTRHPLAKAEHKLLAIEVQLRADPRRRSALLEQATTAYAKAAEPERLVFLRWLNRQNEFARAEQELSLADALKDKERFLVLMDALASQRTNWARMQKIFDEQKVPLEPLLVELFRARIAKELGNPEDAALHWRRVHLTATDQPQAWLYVAQYAERLGQRVEAMKAWRRLTREASLARLAYQALVRLSDQENNTRALRDLVHEMVQVYPDDAAARNDLAYLNLLLNERVADSRKAVEALCAEQPNVLAYRNGLALAHLRAGEALAASKVYEGLQLDWSQIAPGWQAVRVAVLGATGKVSLARVAARQVPQQLLKPEELALIQPYL